MVLRVMTGAAAGRSFRLHSGRVTIGSDESCDVVLRDEGVDPRHAMLEATPEGAWQVTDLGSELGTFVSTRRIRGRVELRGNEELCFGGTFARVTSDDVARRRTELAAVLALAGLVLVGAVVAVFVLRGGGDEDSTGVAVETVTVETVVGTVTVTETEVPLSIEGGGTATEEAPAEEEPSEGATEPAPTETEPFAGEAADEPIVVFDDFSDSASGWETFEHASASAAYSDGAFVMRVESPSVYATADSGRSFAGATVSVVAGNPTRSERVSFGIVCRYRNPDEFVILAASADGRYAIARNTGGALRILSGGGDWANSDAIPVGASTYRLRATCSGDTLRLGVNGRPVASVELPAAPGRVGLFAAGIGEVRFDEFEAVGREA